MPALDALTDRIRAEFTELPGLKITFAQACRLWHANETQCLAALEALVEEGFLRRSASGAFIALPRPHARTLRAVPADTSHAIRCPNCHHLNAISAEHMVAPRNAFVTFRCIACMRLVTLSQMSA